MARRTRAQAAETRESILDAAVTVFSSQGYARSSLLDIAGAAGVSRGAVYWHFDDKKTLFDALMTERVVLPLQASLACLNLPVSSMPLEDMRDCVLAMLVVVVSNHALCHVLETGLLKVEHRGGHECLHAHRRLARDQWLVRALGYVKLASQKGEIGDNLDPEEVGFSIWVMVEGLLHTWLLAPEELDLVRHARCMIDAYIAGLRMSRNRHATGAPALGAREAPFASR